MHISIYRIFFCVTLLFYGYITPAANDRLLVLTEGGTPVIRLYNPNFPNQTLMRNTLFSLLCKLDECRLCLFTKSLQTFSEDLYQEIGSVQSERQIASVKNKYDILTNLMGYLQRMRLHLKTLPEPMEEIAQYEINKILKETATVATFLGDGKLTVEDLRDGHQKLQTYAQSSPYFR